MMRFTDPRTAPTLTLFGALLLGTTYSLTARSEQMKTQPPAESLPPAARIEQLTDNAFGKTISDPYRWMEKSTGLAELQNWMRSQGAYAQRLLQAIPERDKFLNRLKQLAGSATMYRALTPADDLLFYLKYEKDAQLPKLMVRDVRGAERLLLDPATLSKAEGTRLAINNFSPSPDARYVACHLSKGGDEITQARIIETATGRFLPDVLEPIWGEFEVRWLPDSSGVFYTQISKAALENPKLDRLQNMRTYFHRLGSPITDDVLYLGAGVNPQAPFAPEEFPILAPDRDSEWILAFGIGARTERRVMVTKRASLQGATTPWNVLAEYRDKISVAGVHDHFLYYITTNNAPYGELRRLALNTSKPSLAQSEIVVPQSASVLHALVASKDALYYTTMNAGVFRLFRLPYGQKEAVEIGMPFEGSIDLVDSLARTPGLFFGLEGWTQVRRYMAYRPASGKLEELGLKDDSPANYDGYEVKRFEVPSHDGALVPMTVLAKKDLKRDGHSPAIITGYGGYAISRTPRFSSNLLAWLETGGVYAYAHVRGGGEKGRDWHLAGRGKNKKNGVMDLIACAEQLIKNGYTNKHKLAARGGSMGGVLIGRAMTERPDLFGAVAIGAGLLNPLRYLEAPNGANQKSEFEATPETQVGLETLLAMDPYQNLKPGVHYPPTILIVGLNDSRVAPWMSAKFAARLLALQDSRNKVDVLLRTDGEDGHGLVGATKDQEHLRLADEWAFFLKQFHSAGK